MSQQELEQGDLEVMGMVNGHSHPEAAAEAERIAEGDWYPVEEDLKETAEQYQDRIQAEEALYRKRKRMEILRVVLFVAGCLCTAAALVAAWYVPSLLIWVVNAGVLACGIAGAVKIDKYIRWWR